MVPIQVCCNGVMLISQPMRHLDQSIGEGISVHPRPLAQVSRLSLLGGTTFRKALAKPSHFPHILYQNSTWLYRIQVQAYEVHICHLGWSKASHTDSGLGMNICL